MAMPPDDEPLLRRRYLWWPWHFVVNVLAASPMCPSRLRRRLYRLAGIEAHSERVTPGVFFESARVTIHDDAYVNAGVAFFGHGRITLGRSCAIGNEVHFATHHHLPRQQGRAGELVVRPITVGDGAWIGSRAVLLPGVNVGERCIVAAGAVVTSDCEPDGVYAGVPATRQRHLPPLPD
jgi:maltose O-acetyltransferase